MSYSFFHYCVDATIALSIVCQLLSHAAVEENLSSFFSTPLFSFYLTSSFYYYFIFQLGHVFEIFMHRTAVKFEVSFTIIKILMVTFQLSWLFGDVSLISCFPNETFMNMFDVQQHYKRYVYINSTLVTLVGSIFYWHVFDLMLDNIKDIRFFLLIAAGVPLFFIFFTPYLLGLKLDTNLFFTIVSIIPIFFSMFTPIVTPVLCVNKRKLLPTILFYVYAFLNGTIIYLPLYQRFQPNNNVNIIILVELFSAGTLISLVFLSLVINTKYLDWFSIATTALSCICFTTWIFVTNAVPAIQYVHAFFFGLSVVSTQVITYARVKVDGIGDNLVLSLVTLTGPFLLNYIYFNSDAYVVSIVFVWVSLVLEAILLWIK